jgi:hypothetical protein
MVMGCAGGVSWKWTKENTILAGADLILTTLDWSQTRYIAANPLDYYEKNKLLGKHPSDGQVNSYFPMYFAVKTLVSLAIPNPYRYFFQGAMIGQDVYYVGSNNGIGIGFKW